MPETDENAIHADPLWQALLDQWTVCVQQAHIAICQTLGPFETCADPQLWRRRWFETLGTYTELYLRSPAFLRMIKVQLHALVRARRLPHPINGRSNGHGGSAAAELTDISRQLEPIEAMIAAGLEQLQGPRETAGSRSPATGSRELSDQFLSRLRRQATGSLTTAGATPHELVYQQGSLKLLRYGSQPAKYAEPVLICFALVNRPYILDLQDDRSVIRVLCEKGFDVYLIDWGAPREDDRQLRLQDYVCGFMKQVADFTCEHSGSPQLNLLGYCMGGTMSTMFTALHPQQVRNLILMATPIDFAGDEGLLNLWAREENFDVDELIDAYGNCPGEFLQSCFQLMKPVQNFLEKYMVFCERLDDSAYLDDFFAMERWANDSIPVAGETFREYVKLLFQQNRLVKGEMSLADLPIRLDTITHPLLLLVAERDHLVPPSSSLALAKHVRSKEVKSMSIGTGHIGLAVSSTAHRQLWPAAADWIAEHSTQRG